MTSTKSRPNITTELVVAAALDFIAEEGEENLSMRRLADKFGIQAASVYWYVASKDELLGRVADLLYERAASEVHGGFTISPQPTIQQRLIRYHRFLLNNPGAGMLLLSRPPVGESYAAFLGPFLDAMTGVEGYSLRDAKDLISVLLVYVHGCVASQQGPQASVPVMEGRPEKIDTRRFEMGLAILTAAWLLDGKED
jgi:TetR/AcrR family tetracycline transcriptional repressor